MKIDASVTTENLKKRYNDESDPVVKRNFRIVLDHIEAELNGDLEAILATLVLEPIYHVYNITGADGVTHTQVSKGREQTREMYVNALKAKSPQLQRYTMTFIVADAGGLFTDGVLQVPWAGEALRALGNDADPKASYLYEGRLCNLWPVNRDGLLLGEDIYFDPAGFRTILERKIEL